MVNAENLERELMRLLQRRVDLRKSLGRMSFPRDEVRIRGTRKEIRLLQAKETKLLMAAKQSM